MTDEVLIVGGGLAGLCCALHLHKRGVGFQLVEASDRVGGRIRTDVVDGFRLDRGFQVLLTSYPEAKQVLDFDALHLRPFLPGALVRHGGRFHLLADPWRRPFAAIPTLFSPIGSFADKLRMTRLRSLSVKESAGVQTRRPELTTLRALQDLGFSASMMDRFFRPFLGGVFLDPELQTSNRMLHFVFRMFSLGSACLPAGGMEAIPEQLASGLPSSRIRLHTPVASVQPGSVMLESGGQLKTRAVVVAVEGAVAAQLLAGAISPAGQGVTCLYFSAARSPVEQPVLVLNGEGRGPVNNLCVPTLVAPSYAPGGRSLVSVTVLGITEDPQRLQEDVREQLLEWFGPEAGEWQHLRTYRIPYALPRQAPPALTEPERPVRWQPGIYVCGDHRDNASIQGAMVSGRRAAEAVMDDLK